MQSCILVYMCVIMEHCRLLPDWICWSFGITSFNWTVWFIITKTGVLIKRFKLEVSGYRRFHYNGLALISTWISNHM